MQHDSGGNPKEIVNLTLEQFRNFHKTHYTTENAYIVIVSKYPLEKELKIINQYIQNVPKGVRKTVKKQPTQVDVTITEKYSVTDDEKEYFIN